MTNPQAKPGYWVGLMSGTSLDGIDAVLADFGRVSPLVSSYYQPYPAALRERILALHAPGQNELHLAAVLANDLSRAYAAAMNALLQLAGVDARAIAAIGCHGQTIRHRPDLGYTLQLVNGALLAELTGIRVVCDFRSRDIAAGGEGAPLVPAFHQAMFQHPDCSRVIVNIGGIANLTILPVSKKVLGFDCGPGNLLMDAWIKRHRGLDYDANGDWAQSGTAIPTLLHALLSHEYFDRPPPKSTGRDLFHLEWLEKFLSGSEAPEDVQATLLELTAETIARAVRNYCGDAREVYLCGGGARNRALTERLRALLADMKTGVTEELGINADWLEALAFAWLAQRTLAGETGNLPDVTGALGPRVLGAIYPA
ncbi:MAG: anhydro-N-acetylmuramic acid kinase [Pseudomonadota bacterium]